MAEEQIEVNGGIVVYEWVGPDDGEVVVLTPGGRFSKDSGGIPQTAQALAEGGKRVLLWDRPNCGKSDIQLYGRSESHMRAETLGTMLKKLGIEQVVAAGGSGGARDSIVFTLMYPELVSKLITWHIVGGNYSSMSLAGVYVINELRTIRANNDIEDVINLGGVAGGGWKQLIKDNPRNADRLRAIGAEDFHATMERWLNAYIPKANEPIPGVSNYEFAQIKVPTLIVRGGARDFDHPTRTSFEIYNLIEGARLIEPPWAEDAWEVASKARNEGRGNLFDPWVLGVPAFLDFIAGKPAGTSTIAGQ
jgi:2-hydroxy-6-oxonona-2,4-dienedioate hydrolase